MGPVGLSDSCAINTEKLEPCVQEMATSPVTICYDNDTKRIKLIIRTLRNNKVYPLKQTTGTKRKSRPDEDTIDTTKKARPAVNVADTCLVVESPKPAANARTDPVTELKSDADSWIPELGLRAVDRVTLQEGDWLTDSHIVAAQQLLRRQFPALEGLQEPVLGNVLQFKSIVSDGIQVIQNGNNHWVTLQKTRGRVIKVMDSKNMGLTRQLIHQVLNLCSEDDDDTSPDKDPSSADTLEVRLPRMHRQRGSSDCGVFAVAYATEIAFGGNPEVLVYEQKRLRQHLETCLECMQISPFPKKACKARTVKEIGYKTQVVQKIQPPEVSPVLEASSYQRST